MAIDRIIKNGSVAGPEGFRRLDVLIGGDRIIGLATPETVQATNAEVIDASDHLVLPGMVDVHVHTREPGYTHKEDLITCTQAAAAGGVTTIFGMPNLDPPTVTRQDLDQVLDLYGQKSLVDFNHNPAGTRLEEIEALAQGGIAAFKIYMVVDTGRSYPHPSGTGMHDHGHLLQAMRAVATTGLPLMVHPHDQGIMTALEKEWWAKGDRSPQAYAKTLAAYDGVIWDTAIAVLLRLVEATGCRLHIVHTQTRRSIEMIREAKRRGLPVTCEVNHWALFLATWDDVERLGPYALSYWVPDDARAAIWEGVADGTIDLLASDHAPHTRQEKEIGWKDTWASHTGTPGIQYQLPLMIDAARRGLLTVERVVELTAGAPARTFGLRNKGAVVVGADADLVLVDPEQRWRISNEGVLSRCGWTPYDGREITGAVTRTLVRGADVFVDGAVVGQPGFGQQVIPDRVS